MIRKLVHEIIEVSQVVRDLETNCHISAYAALSTLYIVISFFPFAILLISLLNLLTPAGKEWLLHACDSFPYTLQQFLSGILNELEAETAGTILPISVILGIWSASKGTYDLLLGLCTVYGTRKQMGRFRLRVTALLYTVALVTVMIIIPPLMLFGGRLYEWMRKMLPVLPNNDAIIGIFRYFLGALVLILFSISLFLLTAGGTASVRTELPGALCSTIGWIGYSLCYAYYIEHAPNFSIYGSLTAVVLLLLWLYFCMKLLFTGAMINLLLRPCSCISTRS